MARGWRAKWSPSGKGHIDSKREVLKVRPLASIEGVTWDLPPSKSHLIRYLALASLSSQETTLDGVQFAGDDALSMRRCLTQLGVEFSDFDQDGNEVGLKMPANVDPMDSSSSWIVGGVSGQFKRPISVLHAGNSGTALRILAGLVARIDGTVMLDGDRSLRIRDSSTMWNLLQQMGLEVSKGHGEENLPVIVRGPWKDDALAKGLVLDLEKSSQPHSSLMLASQGFPIPVDVSLKGDAVSRKHSGLTARLAGQSGADFSAKWQGWDVQLPMQINVPRDASMLSFAMLFSTLHQCQLSVDEIAEEDWLGCEVLTQINGLLVSLENGQIKPTAPGEKQIEVDLRDANDLITPVAAMLALSCGGIITGAKHAAYKESNRLTKTKELLANFGIDVELTADGLSIAGGQVLTKPTSRIETYGDHRQLMTAVLLASKVGGVIEWPHLHRVADANFLNRLASYGLEFEHSLIQP